MSFCSNCGKENPDSARFCTACGYELTYSMTCPQCGNENPPESHFCFKCGTQLVDGDQSSNVSYNEPSDQVNDTDYETANTYSDNINQEVDWKEDCPFCHKDSLVFHTHRGSLGLGTKRTWECEKCGAAFEQKGDKFKLVRSCDEAHPLWRKYGNSTFTQEEWTRIAQGGVSNRQQRKLDHENELIQQKEAEAQQEKDTHVLFTQLIEGHLNIHCNEESPVILKKGEDLCLVLNNIDLLEARAVRTTHGGYAGPTIRLSKGVSFRLGGVSARSESHDELRTIDEGQLVLTSKRLIFTGSQRTTTIPLGKIVALEPYRDGIASQRENKQKTEYFIGSDKNNINFTVDGRSYQLPVYGAMLKAAIEGKIARL